jgi:hypothetical protein
MTGVDMLAFVYLPFAVILFAAAVAAVAKAVHGANE